MPNRQSAAKQHRQSEDRRMRNKARVGELRTMRKKIERAVHDGKKDEAAALFQTYTKRVDQACAKGVLHKNNAARKKSLVAGYVATMKVPAGA